MEGGKVIGQTIKKKQKALQTAIFKRLCMCVNVDGMEWNGMSMSICMEGRSHQLKCYNEQGGMGKCFAFRGNSFLAFHVIWEKSKGRFLAASCLSTNWEMLILCAHPLPNTPKKKEKEEENRRWEG
ncbi:hypothetical protein LOAG_00630 [Loa loa]|uniref:Uncharacterized protein n=1 Tax=Loa loa TaxID=7209 RepID=A0A1S0UAZ5_LOALO|nr:hypothetical protein LOAG_00630 [Loa loa]EFO27854.1 hypothetical protein LOAG_00630 [Loa loa]